MFQWRLSSHSTLSLGLEDSSKITRNVDGDSVGCISKRVEDRNIVTSYSWESRTSSILNLILTFRVGSPLGAAVEGTADGLSVKDTTTNEAEGSFVVGDEVGKAFPITDVGGCAGDIVLSSAVSLSFRDH